jgi:serine/threonine protein kinase
VPPLPPGGSSISISSSSSSNSSSSSGSGSAPPPSQCPFSRALFFQPRGENAVIRNDRDVEEAFDCLEWLRELRVIHRDLSPRHFLRAAPATAQGTGELFLIDFGFAVLLPSDRDLDQESSDELTFSGSSYYAPTRLLRLLRASRSSVYRGRLADDLESIVKLCWVSQFLIQKAQLYAHDKSNYPAIHDFWTAREQEMDDAWRRALTEARANRLDEAKKAVLQCVPRA